MTLKHNLRTFVAYHYNNYIQRGYSRFSWLTLAGVIVADVGIIFGRANIYIISIIVFVSALILFDLFGQFDYSNKGTRTLETKKYWESDFGIAPQLAIYEMLSKIAKKQGVEETEDFKNMKTWLEAINKKHKFGEMVKEDLKSD